MGYSARYHAASLAAVLVALAIGILIGVGLGDTVKGTTADLEASLKGNVESARNRADTLQGELNTERGFSDQIFPVLVGDLLRGDRIAVIALGDLPDNMKGDIESVVGTDSPTGAQLAEVAVVSEPPDLRGLVASAAKGSPFRGSGGNSDASALARRAGRSLVVGGAAFNRFRDALLSSVSGHPGRIDGVIVVRQQPADLNAAQSAATDRLESGLLAGIKAAGPVPVVGVERSDSNGSQIAFFDSQGLPATVDSIDLTSGRVALAYALHGAQGDYGIKPTADRLLPALRRQPATAGTASGSP